MTGVIGDDDSFTVSNGDRLLNGTIVTVTFTAEDGATVKYTTNGNDPAENGTEGISSIAMKKSFVLTNKYKMSLVDAADIELQYTGSNVQKVVYTGLKNANTKGKATDFKKYLDVWSDAKLVNNYKASKLTMAGTISEMH